MSFACSLNLNRLCSFVCRRYQKFYGAASGLAAWCNDSSLSDLRRQIGRWARHDPIEEPGDGATRFG